MKKILVMMAVISSVIFSVAKAQTAGTKTDFDKTLNAYFNLKNDLAKDNATLAMQNAKALLTNIESFPTSKLSASQQALWKTESAKIKTSALAISKEKAIKVQRQSFWALSSSMINLAKSFKSNSEVVYVQYCPMAKKSWLNEVEDVQNPFYGSMMYDCGEVTETIAKK